MEERTGLYTTGQCSTHFTRDTYLAEVTFKMSLYLQHIQYTASLVYVLRTTTQTTTKDNTTRCKGIHKPEYNSSHPVTLRVLYVHLYIYFRSTLASTQFPAG